MQLGFCPGHNRLRIASERTGQRVRERLGARMLSVLLFAAAVATAAEPQTPDRMPAWSLEKTQIEQIPSDGLQKADLTGDGQWELIVAVKNTEVRWYRHEDGDEWEAHTVAGGFDEIEGVDAGDFDGDGRVEIVVLDQDGGQIVLAKADSDDPAGDWSTAVLDDGATMAQASFVTDVDADGDLDLVYTYDGRVDGEGGVYWLENRASDVLAPENWAKHEMVQINGGHGLHDDWVQFPDRGERDGLVGSTRLTWNDASVGEVFWLERPDDPRQPWTKHTIVDDPSRHVTVGDFSGDGEANDVFTLRRDQGKGLYWYELQGDETWQEHTVTTEGGFRMVSSHDFTDNGIPEVLASEWKGDNALRIYQKIGNRFEMVARQPYAKTDDRILYIDLTDDGETEMVTTSDHRTFDYWKVNWTHAPTDPPEPIVTGYGEGVFEVGELLHADDFQSMDNWIPQVQVRSGGDPQIRLFEGALEARTPESAATIWYRHKLEGPVAIVYRVTALPVEDPRGSFMPRDINCFWHASDPADPARVVEDKERYTGAFPSYHKQHGYYASIGGGRNTTTRFRRYPRQVDGKSARHIALSDRDGQDDYLIQPGRTYTIQLVAYNDIIQYIVDGRVFYEIREGDTVTVEGGGGKETITYTRDRFPVYTEGWCGFRLTSAHHRYANFRVYRLVESE